MGNTIHLRNLRETRYICVHLRSSAGNTIHLRSSAGTMGTKKTKQIPLVILVTDP